MDIVYTPYAEPDDDDGRRERRSDDAVVMESTQTEEDCNRLHLLANLTSKLKPKVDKGNVLHPSDAESEIPTPLKLKLNDPRLTTAVQ